MAGGVNTYDGGHAQDSLDKAPLTEAEIRLLRRMLSRPDLFPEEFKGWLPREIERNPPLLGMENITGSVQRGAVGIDLNGSTNPAINQSIRWRRDTNGALVASMAASGPAVNLTASDPDAVAGAASIGLTTQELGSGYGTPQKATLNLITWSAANAAIVGYKGRVQLDMCNADDSIRTRVLDQSDATTGKGASNWMLDRVNGQDTLNGIMDCASGYWRFDNLTDDYANRFYASATTTVYKDTAGTIVGNDGILTIPRTGTYLVFIGTALSPGTVANPGGYYHGAHWFHSTNGHYTIWAANSATLIDNDTFDGGGQGVIIQHFVGGTTLRAQMWMKAGGGAGGMYVTFSLIRLPV